MIVKIEGREYDLKVHNPVCENWHFHDELHPDGTVGTVQHHHHDSKCERRTALLIPVESIYPDWPEIIHDHPAQYRVRRDDRTYDQQSTAFVIAKTGTSA